MVELSVLNPVADTGSEKGRVEPATRLSDLKGKTIGLFYNQKSGGDLLLRETAELMKRRYGDIKFRNYLGAVGNVFRHTTSEQVDTIVKECDAVIGATAD